MSSLLAKSPVPALLIAAFAAIGASVCCIVPLVLVLLGISGAWIANLTALDAWRPWLSGAALVSLAFAFIALYRPASQCRIDEVCMDPRILRRRRQWLWIATLLIALLLLFPYYAIWMF